MTRRMTFRSRSTPRVTIMQMQQHRWRLLHTWISCSSGESLEQKTATTSPSCCRWRHPMTSPTSCCRQGRRQEKQNFGRCSGSCIQSVEDMKGRRRITARRRGRRSWWGACPKEIMVGCLIEADPG